MNWVDFAILATIAWFTFAAFHAGFIREVITIIGAVVAVALAGLLYTNLAADIHVAVKDAETSEVLAFCIIFSSVIITSQLLALFLKQAASLLMLGLFDAMGGALIGFLKAFIFIEIFSSWQESAFESLGVRQAIIDSAFSGFFLQWIPVIKYILPGEFKTAISELPH